MLKYLLGKVPAAAAAAWLALAPLAAGAAGPAWEEWHPIKGAFDVDGPRTDGSLVVAGAGALYLVDAEGDETPFARGPGGYREDAGAEAYIAVSPGGEVAAAECSFRPDEVFILRLHVPIGITRVSASGDETGSFANLGGVSGLSGLAFDNVGFFGHRLLVTGVSGSKTVLFAIDCNGAVTTITKSAPALEGGLAVAPSSFGSFGGSLIAPDENSGQIYAIAPDGKVTSIAKPALPVGGDVGVEGVGFVPAGFVARGGAAYYADRGTAGSPHPGSDSILRMTSADIAAAGVQDGDMLVVTEGGAQTVAIRCDPTCKVIPIVATATKAHGEGHIAFTLNPPPPSPVPAAAGTVKAPLIPLAVVDFAGNWGVTLFVIALLVAVLSVVTMQAIRRRAK